MSRPRYLKPTGGYTTSWNYAMRSPEEFFEPEPITVLEQAELSARARTLFEMSRAEELAKAETRSRCNRLRTLEIEARRKAIDPTRALAQIERGMMMLEQMVRGTIFRGTA